MESKKNKKSPKNTKKKTSSPSNIILPVKVKDESKPPEKVNNTNNINNTDNNINNNNSKEKTEEKEKKDEKEEITEIKKDISKKLEDNMALDFDEEERFGPLYLNEFNSYFRPIRGDTESPNDRITTSLKKLEKGDDMDILNELVNLREFLSMSSERIGFNPNIGKLLEEICKNLSKTYLPEMIIYCLQCINYIIDINPTLSSILKKTNAIPTIMNTITAVEDISCVEHIIKIFEKISIENSRILLENQIFETFLVNIFDFLNIYQKKSIMKICYNMTSRRLSVQDYNLYIKPAMKVLINLIYFDDNSEIENLSIAENGVNIFYNIINQLKYGIIYETEQKQEKEKEKEKEKNNNEIINNNDNNNNNIVDEIIKDYQIIENYKLILDKFFLKNSKIITEHLIQNILKSIVIILDIVQPFLFLSFTWSSST